MRKRCVSHQKRAALEGAVMTDHPILWLNDQYENEIQGRGATMPLAICIAALQAQEKNDG